MLVVSRVDLITLRVLFKSIEVRSTRAVVVAHSTLEKQMFPLSLFDVRVALWLVLPSGEHVFRIESVASGAPMTMQSRHLLGCVFKTVCGRSTNETVSAALLRYCVTARQVK